MYQPKAKTEVNRQNIGSILLKALKWTGCMDCEDVAREVYCLIRDRSMDPGLNEEYRQRLSKAAKTLAEEMKERKVYLWL